MWKHEDPWFPAETQGLKLGYLDSNQEQLMRAGPPVSDAATPKSRVISRKLVDTVYLLLRAETDCFWHFKRVYYTQSGTFGTFAQPLDPKVAPIIEIVDFPGRSAAQNGSNHVMFCMFCMVLVPFWSPRNGRIARAATGSETFRYSHFNSASATSRLTSA